MRLFCALFLLGSFFPPLYGYLADEDLLIEHLNGIVLLGSPEQLRKSGIEGFSGIRADGLDVPGSLNEFAETFCPFVNHPLTMEGLAELKNQIRSYFEEHGQPFVMVATPEQDLTAGVLQIVILEGRVGEVRVLGNRWFPDRLLRRYVPLKQGDTVDSKEILNDVAWMNRNPFHKTDVVFTAGQTMGETDVELVTSDRFPLRPYAGADNTGNHATENVRLFGGFQCGNVFGCDQQLFFQATYSPNFDHFQSYTLFYSAPLPWRNTLVLYGGYSRVKPDITDFHSTGQSSQASLRYNIPFQSFYSSYLELVLGFDFKNTNNNLLFLDTLEVPIVTSNVNITQALFELDYGKQWPNHQISFSTNVFYSPGRWVPHQSNSDYRHLRYRARNQYVYGRLLISDLWKLPKAFAVFACARAQGSSQNLLPSEQFGLGGYDTVRGYDEREVNADNALCVNLEIRTVPFNPRFFHGKAKEEFVLLVFGDYGLGNDLHRLEGQEKFQTLIGVGPGLRYSAGTYLTARLDWGFRLHKVHGGQGYGNKLHFGAMLSY